MGLDLVAEEDPQGGQGNQSCKRARSACCTNRVGLREERRRRVGLTRANASLFIAEAQKRGNPFVPVGVIQGVDASDFGRQVPEYAGMGYRHLAVGGLVALNDRVLLDVMTNVMRAVGSVREPLWAHLFGVYRPRPQRRSRELGVDSFDSATHFRKAWLHSDQDYIAVDGQWYAALRVPMTSDERRANPGEAQFSGCFARLRGTPGGECPQGANRLRSRTRLSASRRRDRRGVRFEATSDERGHRLDA